ncbi:PAS domain S-box protein [Maribacter sp. 2304DJ31-5]|uniref:PAS domain S-box protein n=1 Tax=Maribacter sp. 2304DJ31-5 TaxID=3386273 RepID=UPI0039BC4460
METLSVNFLIKDSPAAVAILDNDLKFISYSNIWLHNFGGDQTDLRGKKIFDVVKNTPPSFAKALNECLKGTKNENLGEKIILPEGRIQWLKWRIKAWDDEGSVKGVILTMEDITIAQRDKELLLKAEKVSRTGGWEVDLLQNKVYWSPVTREIHEVPNDYVPSLQEGINFYKEGEHRNKITDLVSTAIADGTPWDTELVIITAKGNEVWVRAKGEAEFINNSCVRLIGTFQDIDEQKKAELKYKETAERLKVATKTANIGIWEYCILKNNLVWDDNMYRLYGVKKQDFSGEYEAWESGVHPEDKERGKLEVEQAISGKKEFDTEFRVLWPDGTVRNIRAIAKTERDAKGNAIKMTGANWDITELKQTRLKLERNKESFTETFKNSAAGMALVGLDGRWIRVNEGLCKSLGYTEEELLKLTFQDITYPDDLDIDLGLFQEVLDNKRDSYQLEKRYYHKSGRLVHTILTVTVVKTIEGNISHFISQILDITSRIEAEKRLKTLVEITKGQNDSLLNFAHIVSHNLRSHSSNMSMLAKFLIAEENEREKKNLNDMLFNATDRLSETVQHLNEVVQFKTGALENMQSTSLLNTLANIEKSIEGLLRDKGAVSYINVEKSHFVNAVPAYLESIFLNLYTNAIKYSASDRSPVIKITSMIENDTVLIKFKDNGQGINLKRHGNSIFGMYKTFHKHKDAKGIGLFITKNQVESMNGTISVESEVDKGTTFCITLKEG